MTVSVPSIRALPAKERVLIVDDEPQVLVALEDLLSDRFVVLRTDSGESALNLIEQERDIAVVLSDQRMPRMQGDQLLAALSERSEATRILVTGYTDLTAVIRAVNDGNIFAYITKPWDRDDLMMKVTKATERFRLARELAHERQLLDDLMNSTPDAIFFKDQGLRFLRVNRAFASIVNGGNPAGIVGKRLSDLGLPGDVVERVEEGESRVLSEGHVISDEVREVPQRGTSRWFSSTKAPFRSPDGDILGLVGIARDVSLRKQHEDRIARLTRIHGVLSSINSLIIRVEEREPLVRESCRIAVQVGELPLAMVANVDGSTGKPSIVASEGTDAGLIERLARGLESVSLLDEGEFGRTLRARQPLVLNDLTAGGIEPLRGELVGRGHVALAVFPLFASGRLDGLLLLSAKQTNFFDAGEMGLLSELSENISLALDHVAQAKRLKFLAYYDELTGLPKRELLVDRIDQQLGACRSEGRRLAVTLLDIGRFRQINETLGRRGGDELLLRVVERLASAAGAQDTVARFDSNTFAVLSLPPGDESEVVAWLEKIVFPQLGAPFTVEGTELRISARAGIALFPSDGGDADALIANAEAALKKAKLSAQPYLFYAPSMNERVAEKLTLETKLRGAIEREEFVLHYQPKVDLKTRRVVGLEALIRWNDPESGLVPPVRFIPVLEETGLILDVGRWVLEKAAEQYTAWAEQGLAAPRIAVNVSTLQLGQRDFVRSVEHVLSRFPRAAEGLDLEITESVLIENLGGNTEKLRAVREKGLHVAIDDFGTGYSSLGYLSRLPIDSLKVDRSFVIRMSDDPQDMTIVMAILSLAHSLDLVVIAEGVETANQAHLLRLLRCDQIQGYLVARPMPAEQVVELLDKTFELGPVSAGRI